MAYDPRWELVNEIRRRTELEKGIAFAFGKQRVALLYPSLYQVGMSSLGYQWIGHILSQAGFGVERFFLPSEKPNHEQPRSYETHHPLSSFSIIAVSVSWELELAGLIRALTSAGIPALSSERTKDHPVVILGGPITFSNPLPASVIADVVLSGDADFTIVPAIKAFFEYGRDRWLEKVELLDGAYVKGATLKPPVINFCEKPAHSRIISPETVFPNMFLVEASRGCSRGCAFCVMGRQSRKCGSHIYPIDAILEAIPHDATKVGLVGASVSDHPDLMELLTTLTKKSIDVGVSSLRADVISQQPELASILRNSGYKTLTIAADGASEKLRRNIKKGIKTKHLIDSAKIAKEEGYLNVKLYQIIGLPEETDDDISELIETAKELSSIHNLTITVSPLVPKKRTPLENAPFAGIKTLEQRLNRIQKELKKTVDVRVSSPKWAWVEYVISQGDVETGVKIIDVANQTSFSAWKKALT